MNNHNIEKEVKLQKLKDNFYNGGPIRFKVFKTRDHEGHLQWLITRYHLREMVSGVLNITDAHTINGWINLLITRDALEHNPTSDRSPNGHIIPTNDTRYIINYEKCTHPHLSSFNPSTATSVKATLDPDTTSSSF